MGGNRQDANGIPISRRDALRRLAAMAGACTLGPAFLESCARSRTDGGQASAPPNILWFIGDDVGRQNIGCDGNPAARTPNLDGLAADGVRFTNAFVTSPSCSPTRNSMFSGQVAHTLRVEDLHAPLPQGVDILPTLLRARGYWSGLVGKNHMGPHAAAQFDMVAGGVGKWRDFFDQRPKDRPFFLTVAFYDAHRPFDQKALDPPTDPAAVVVPPYLPDIPEVRRELAYFCDEIGRMDLAVGRILQRLDEEGLAENTLVLFVGDNGMPFPRAKTTLYDSGIGTPLVVRWPGHAPKAATRAGLVSTIDLAPTMLAAAGLDAPAPMHGRTLLPMLADPKARPNTVVFAERNWHCIDDHIRAVRTERLKYIRNAYPDEPLGYPPDITREPSFQAMRKLRDAGRLTPEQMLQFRKPRPREELYDVTADPYEFTNLADDPAHRETLAALRVQLDRWIADTDDVPVTKRLKNTHDPETAEQISEYGPRE